MKKEQARERRQALKSLSDTLKHMVNTGQMLPSTDGTTNGLLRDFYEQSGHTDLKTYKEWRSEGYQVKKGEKAILLWAHPKPSKAAKEAAKSIGKPEEEAKEDYFPVIYLFSRKQVKKS